MTIDNKKVAIITGASEGIGAALSLELLQNNFKVIGISSNKKKIKKIKNKLSHFNTCFKMYCADVRNYDDLKKISLKVKRIDLLILNAGIYQPVRVDRPNLQIFKTHYDVNFMGVLNAYVAFISKMISSKQGTILIMSSITAWIGLPKAAAYGPTKSALKSFAQSARYDLDKYGIKIKVCSPGFVDTPATKKNNFYMPGLLEADIAAKKIFKGINSKKFEITFPFMFSTFMKVLSILPNEISYKLIKKVIS